MSQSDPKCMKLDLQKKFFQVSQTVTLTSGHELAEFPLTTPIKTYFLAAPIYILRRTPCSKNTRCLYLRPMRLESIELIHYSHDRGTQPMLQYARITKNWIAREGVVLWYDSSQLGRDG
jgi:hypothetical protein